MNAVNLIPADLRRGSGAPARSGPVVYILLGVLAVAVVLASATALLKRTVANREAEVARVEAEAITAEARAAELTRYKALAAKTAERVAGIKQVAEARVDWSSSLREVSQTIGTQVSFESVTARTPGAAGAAGATSAPAATTPPAIDIVGCARDHRAVARLIARFRGMAAVQRVALAQSHVEEPASGGPAGGSPSSGAATAADCHRGGRLSAKFTLTVFLKHDKALPAPRPARPTAVTRRRSPCSARPCRATTACRR
jgi:Tfp pilus assembly protein PilN